MQSRVGWSAVILLLLSGIDIMPSWAASAGEYRQMGLEYRQTGQFPEAIAALEQAVQLEPEHLPGRVMLGWTQHLAGQEQAAAQTLQANLQRDPFHLPTLNALGIVYLVNDDLAGAALTHSWAAWLAPDNEIAHYNLSLAWQRLSHLDWAIQAAQRAVQLEPENPHPWIALALAQWENQETATAQRTFQQAVDLDARYGSQDFLTFLKEAGFSSEQIELAQQVLSSLMQGNAQHPQPL